MLNLLLHIQKEFKIQGTRIQLQQLVARLLNGCLPGLFDLDSPLHIGCRFFNGIISLLMEPARDIITTQHLRGLYDSLKVEWELLILV